MYHMMIWEVGDKLTNQAVSALLILAVGKLGESPGGHPSCILSEKRDFDVVDECMELVEASLGKSTPWR